MITQSPSPTRTPTTSLFLFIFPSDSDSSSSGRSYWWRPWLPKSFKLDVIHEQWEFAPSSSFTPPKMQSSFSSLFPGQKWCSTQVCGWLVHYVRSTYLHEVEKIQSKGELYYLDRRRHKPYLPTNNNQSHIKRIVCAHVDGGYGQQSTTTVQWDTRTTYIVITILNVSRSLQKLDVSIIMETKYQQGRR